MSQQQSDQTEVNSTYSSEPGTQTNPFNGDQMGEFTSNFGTNTNAVSQIFKEGQFSQNRSKMMIIVAVLAILGGGAFFFLTSEDSMDEEFLSTDENISEDENATADEEMNEDENAVEDEDANSEELAADEASADEDNAVAEEAATEEMADTEMEAVAEEAMPAGTDVPVLAGPADGAARAYDETSGSAEFSWDGSPGGWIVFSRSSSMTPQTMRIKVDGNSYMFNHPWPGTWYWRVDNGAGSSEVRSFKIAGAVRRNVMIAEPQANGTISGNGGLVSWQGDGKVAYYKVELTNGSWANPMHKFSTAGTQVQLQGVQPGQYQLRVGAFSEVAGRWEFTQGLTVTVQ